MTDPRIRRDGTLCAGAGAHHERGAVVPPIYQTANFRFDNTEQVAALARGESDHLIYSRYGNPTVQAVEEQIARLEGGRRAFAFAAGQAATSAWCYAHLRPGDRFVVSNRLYGGTTGYMNECLAPFGIAIEQVDFTDLDAVDRALDGAKGCWFETPTNPTAQVIDGPAVASLCRKHGVLSAVDNTFATPINQKPFDWGIDWIMHSVTKYLNGHGDLIGGVLVAREGIATDMVARFRKNTGGIMDPHAAFLLHRGMRTLVVRVERHNANALALARHLKRHPKVACVHYPGLEDDPGHVVARRQMRGFGGIVAVDIAGGYEAAARFIDHLQVIVNAASLGGTESLVSMPVLTSHINATPEERAMSRVTDATVRISVGIEDIEDLVEDVDSALSAV